MPARSNNLIREANLRVSSSRRKRGRPYIRGSCRSRYREAFSMELAVVGPVAPDLLGEVAAQKAPYLL